MQATLGLNLNLLQLPCGLASHLSARVPRSLASRSQIQVTLDHCCCCLTGPVLQWEWGSHLAEPVGHGGWHAACRARVQNVVTLEHCAH